MSRREREAVEALEGWNPAFSGCRTLPGLPVLEAVQTFRWFPTQWKRSIRFQVAGLR